MDEAEPDRDDERDDLIEPDTPVFWMPPMPRRSEDRYLKWWMVVLALVPLLAALVWLAVTFLS